MVRKTLCFLMFVLVAIPAIGATLCVQLDVNALGTGFTYEDDGPSWTVTEENGTVIKGVGLCSVTAGGFGQASDEIKFSTTGQIECWCKMLSPAVSKWIYYYPYEDEATCVNRCSYRCGDYVNRREDFRTAMFNSII